MVYVWRGVYPDPYNGNQMVQADFIIKSNSLSNLGISSNNGNFPNNAILQGGCNFQVNRASDGVQIGGTGNYTFTMQAMDSGMTPPAGTDTFALTVYDQNAVPFKTIGTTYTQGGDIVVHFK